MAGNAWKYLFSLSNQIDSECQDPNKMVRKKVVNFVNMVCGHFFEHSAYFLKVINTFESYHQNIGI